MGKRYQGLSLRANSEEIKTHTMAAVGEVVGTAMFLFIAEGAAKTANLARTATQTQTNAPLDSQTIMMIATAFGLSLLVTAWMFYRITGGLFNPAITVALWLTGVLTTTRAAFLFGAQLIGGIIASALVLALTPTGSQGIDVVNTTISGQISQAQGAILEFLGTSVLVFAVLMLAVEKHRATYLAPVGIGLTLFVLHIFLVAWTGCSLNPARSLGPAVAGRHFPSYHWIYWVAPLAGGVMSMIYHQVLKALKYNSAVMDQDSDHEVGGLRPVHMRVYKFFAGHHDWEKTPESHQHGKKRFMWVTKRHKMVHADGTTGYAEHPEMVAVNNAHPHDSEINSLPSTANGEDSKLPMPVQMQSGPRRIPQSGDTLVQVPSA
ncbi:hypothetical protein LTR62_006067 [Meristemomyces frigidus]|uniref:Aquaporin n=1 Tax=Meristemomyces frigidus TaxID=1508187 RepID=A0AAN7TEX0_9PEZI|nr:hypothetical protein LTR62_006067 [Meristemomyces frigidus]